MPAGLQVTGDHTFLQIDETYRNLVFKSKGTKTMDTTLIGGTTIYGGNFNITAVTFPFVAVRSSARVSFAGFTKSGATYTMYYFTNTSGASVEWYHFDTPTTGETSNYLAIFDAAGELVYNALAKPMIVTAFNAYNASYTGTSGRKYASMQSAQGYSERERPNAMTPSNGTLQTWQPYHSWSSDHVSTMAGGSYATGLQIQSSTGSYLLTRDDGNFALVKHLIVDVTGL